MNQQEGSLGCAAWRKIWLKQWDSHGTVDNYLLRRVVDEARVELGVGVVLVARDFGVRVALLGKLRLHVEKLPGAAFGSLCDGADEKTKRLLQRAIDLSNTEKIATGPGSTGLKVKQLHGYSDGCTRFRSAWRWLRSTK